MEDDGELQDRILALERKLANVRQKTAEMQASPLKSGSDSSSLGSSLETLSRGSLFQRTEEEGVRRTDKAQRGMGRYDRDIGDLAQSKDSGGYDAYITQFSQGPDPTQDTVLRRQLDALQTQLARQQQQNEASEQRYRSEIERIKADAAKYLVEKDGQIRALEEALQTSADPREVARLSEENAYLGGRLKQTEEELDITKEMLEEFKGEFSNIKKQFASLKSDKQHDTERAVKALEAQVKEYEGEVKEAHDSKLEAEKRYRAQVQSLDKDLRAAHDTVRKAEAEVKQLQRQLVHVNKEHQEELRTLQGTFEENRAVKAASQQASEQQAYTLEMNELKRELQTTQRKLQDLMDENQELKANQKAAEHPRPAKRQRPGSDAMWSPRVQEETNPITHSKPSATTTLERELTSLQQDRARLEAEVGRMPEYPKTMEGRKKKQQIEYDLKVIDTNIGEIKRQLRGASPSRDHSLETPRPLVTPSRQRG
jgi:chromosome segregation ATPase